MNTLQQAHFQDFVLQIRSPGEQSLKVIIRQVENYGMSLYWNILQLRIEAVPMYWLRILGISKKCINKNKASEMWFDFCLQLFSPQPTSLGTRWNKASVLPSPSQPAALMGIPLHRCHHSCWWDQPTCDLPIHWGSRVPLRCVHTLRN